MAVTYRADGRMSVVRDHRDPKADKQNALKLAAHASKRSNATLHARDAAIRFARDHGASLRELAEATGLGHMTIKRIVDQSDLRS
jgi:hypothetical protein